MDWNRVEGNWKEFRGKVKEKWGKLTDDDLTAINGKRDQRAAHDAAAQGRVPVDGVREQELGEAEHHAQEDGVLDGQVLLDERQVLLLGLGRELRRKFSDEERIQVARNVLIDAFLE